jgi:hypothetical protein
LAIICIEVIVGILRVNQLKSMERQSYSEQYLEECVGYVSGRTEIAKEEEIYTEG